jgi:hypothetical protein
MDLVLRVWENRVSKSDFLFLCYFSKGPVDASRESHGVLFNNYYYIIIILYNTLE